MNKVIIQLHKVKNKQYVYPQYIEILKKHGAIREEKIWEELPSGKKEHRGAFNYYITEKGNQMLNLFL